MFKSIIQRIPRDRDYPERQWRNDVLTRVLEGRLYDDLPYSFHTEKNEADEYVPLRDRRPSARYALCRTVVDDSVALLFSEGHFPDIDCEDEATRDALAALVRETALNQTMIEAATRGSVGSVAIWMRVLKGRVFFSALNTQYLTPAWQPDAPDVLVSVTEKYKVSGAALVARGYAGVEPRETYWFQRVWDAAREVWYLPWPVGEREAAPQEDAQRSTSHGLGFVPLVWVRNLPGGDDTDGAPTFPPEAVENQVEIDYQLSQAGRGLKYSSDPTLLIKEPAMGDGGQMVKGGGNAIVVSAEGDAKMLEINGTAATAVIEYVRCLRELALESAHGNRANADKLSAAQSGRAMELMNQGLVWLADRLRISYGEGALRELLSMVVKAAAKYPLAFKDGTRIGELKTDARISLRWPAWYQPTATDAQAKALTLQTHRDAGHMSRETAIKALAADYDIEDVGAEIASIEAEETARSADSQQQAPGTIPGA